MAVDAFARLDFFASHWLIAEPKQRNNMMSGATFDRAVTTIGFKAVRALSVGVAVLLILQMQHYLTTGHWKVAFAVALASLFNVANSAVTAAMLVLVVFVVMPPEAVKAISALIH